jgi:tetratricopeptide (TPR) repeat protein
MVAYLDDSACAALPDSMLTCQWPYSRLVLVIPILANGSTGPIFPLLVPVMLVLAGLADFVARILHSNARTAAADRRASDVMRRNLGRMAEYMNGLPTADPVVRGPFELGLAAMRACRWDEAVKRFQRAMAATTGVHHVALLNLIGVCRYTQGHRDDALRYFEESVRVAEQVRANRGKAQALNNIALVYHDNGEPDSALKCLEESLAIARESDDQWATAVQLGNVGNIWHDKGDLDRALDYYERALAMSRELGDEWGVASDLANIGSVYLDKGILDKALQYDEEALATARGIGYWLGVVTGLANVANIHRQKGRLDKALAYEGEALRMARKAGYTLGVAVDLGNIGLDLTSQRKHKEAVPRLAAALTILIAAGVADGPRQALTGLIRCEDKLGRERVVRLLKETRLDEVKVSDLLGRIDQMRMKRPLVEANLQLGLAAAGR